MTKEPTCARRWVVNPRLAVFPEYLALSLLLVLLAPTLRAQSPTSLSVLQPELQPLEFFIGQWNCAGEFPASHKPISSHIVFSPELDGSWLVVRWDDNPPNQFHALELWGFDKAAHHLTNSIYNNFGGTYVYPSPGWIGDKLTWARELPANSPATSERYVFDRKSAKEFVYSWELRKAQADWVTGDRLTCSR